MTSGLIYGTSGLAFLACFSSLTIVVAGLYFCVWTFATKKTSLVLPSQSFHTTPFTKSAINCSSFLSSCINVAITYVCLLVHDFDPDRPHYLASRCFPRHFALRQLANTSSLGRKDPAALLQTLHRPRTRVRTRVPPTIMASLADTV